MHTLNADRAARVRGRRRRNRFQSIQTSAAPAAPQPPPLNAFLLHHSKTATYHGRDDGDGRVQRLQGVQCLIHAEDGEFARVVVRDLPLEEGQCGGEAGACLCADAGKEEKGQDGQPAHDASPTLQQGNRGQHRTPPHRSTHTPPQTN